MRITYLLFAFLLISELSAYPEASPATVLSALDAASQPPISASLGRSLRNYWMQPQAHGFRAQDVRRHLTADFTAAGVELKSTSGYWKMAASAYGYGNQMEALSAVAPQAEANRVEYRRGQVTEWYVHGPVGLEQGFTISAPPDRTADGPLTVALTLSGDAVTVIDDHKALSFVGPDGKPKLRYGGLVAYDRTGRQLPALLELQDRQILLRVTDRNAQYPIVVDPWVQTAELAASDGGADDQFGWSVAVSSNVVVVGAPFHAIGQRADQGIAYVFVMPQSGWSDATETAELAASDGSPNDYFGSAVAISGDTIVVGAGGATVNGNPHQGAAYVFVKSPGGWTNMTQTAKLVSSDGYVGDNFGGSVAIRANTVGVGAPYASVGSNSQQGAAYVFVKPNNGWTDMSETAKLGASDGAAADVLGASVAVTGNTFVAGASGAAVAGNPSAGAAYVFVRPPSGWANATQTAKLTTSQAMPDDYFGSSVSISDSTIAIGAPSDYTGAAYVFVKPPGGWSDMTQTAELTADGVGSQLLLGTSVATNGNTVVAGAVGNPVDGNAYQGTLFVFVEPPAGWSDVTQNSKLNASDGAAGDYFGRSVSMSGTTGVASAPFHRVGTNDAQGTAYIFQTVNKRPKAGTLTPDSAVAGDPGFQLTVEGEDFVQGAVVNWNGSPRQTNYISSTKLQAAILASDIAVGGKYKVSVTNPPPGGGDSNKVTFTVQNPTPQIQTLDPDHATVGDPTFTLTVEGSNFVSGCKVTGNGKILDTTFVNSNKVTAVVPGWDLKQPGTAQITVVNPGGVRSNALPFTVNNPLPVLTKLNPSSAKAGGPGFTLTILGTGFVAQSHAHWRGSLRDTTVIGPGKLQVKILASDIAKAGTADVTVKNPSPGGGVSNALQFTINP